MFRSVLLHILAKRDPLFGETYEIYIIVTKETVRGSGGEDFILITWTMCVHLIMIFEQFL